MFARCRTTFRLSGSPASRTSAAAREFARVRAARRRLRRPASARRPGWKAGANRARPRAAKRRARRSRPRPLVRRFVYSPAARAAAMISARSARASGSPPEKPACSTPSSAASAQTRRHSLGRQLRARGDLRGIRAIGTVQRTAVGELREQRVRARNHGWRTTKLRLCNSRRHAGDIRRELGRRGVVFRRPGARRFRRMVRTPSQRVRISCAVALSCRKPSG